MSQCSDLSTISVSLNGQQVNVETAITETINALQNHLNKLSVNLRSIAMSNDQCTGEGLDDIKRSCAEVEELQDHMLEMNNLFEDLVDMSDQLVYLPENKEEKEFLKEHKIERKAKVAAMKKKFEEARKANKLAIKEAKKNAKSTMKTIMEDD